MIDEILAAAGMPYRRTRFPSPPADTYAVYMDNVETDGPDGVPCIYTHSTSVELYEPAPDDAAEKQTEDAICAAGLQYQKQDRIWLQDEQRYMTVYDFDWIEKRRIT